MLKVTRALTWHITYLFSWLLGQPLMLKITNLRRHSRCSADPLGSFGKPCSPLFLRFRSSSSSVSLVYGFLLPTAAVLLPAAAARRARSSYPPKA